MPDQAPYLGSYLTAYIPNADALIDLGYDTVRFYTASSEAGSYSLVGTATLADGTDDYNYNDTSGLITDWFYWVPYSVANAEGTAAEPTPVGPPRVTRLNLRQDVGKFLRMVDVYSLAAASSTTVATISELIDADADVDTIGGRFARVVSGTGTGQTRRIRAGATGYSSLTTGQITVGRAFSPTWAAADSVELWEPEGNRDPSTYIDLAMQISRLKVWWEDVFYFTSDSSVTEYSVPQMMKENYITRVEYVTDSYPDSPGWAPVQSWQLTAGLITVPKYSAGTVFRVVWNRYGDRMDSDTDYWECDREWAMLETAVVYLTSRASPTGNKEDVADALRAREAVLTLVASPRRVLMPSGTSTIEGPR